MSEATTEQIRDLLEYAMSDAPAPHDWSVVQRRADAQQPAPPPQRRTAVWLGAAAAVAALVAGFLVVVADDEDDERIRIDDPTTTVEETPTTTIEETPATTSSSVPSPETTVGVTPAVDEESTAETGTPSTAAPDTEIAVAAPPPELDVPRSGETQQTVIGDIAWTLLEGDETTQPESISAVIDGVFYGLEGGGQGGTWRSEDALEWELTDLTPNGIVGVFEIDGDTWARRSTLDGQGLGRWNGELFEPVDLPPSLAPEVEGLQATPAFSSDPVQLGDEWVVPVTTRLGIAWNEFFPALSPEWDAVTETIRMFDWEANSPLPEAVLDVELVDGDPMVLEIRDADTGSLVTAIEVPAGSDPGAFVQQLVYQGGFSFQEFLVGDGDGFDAVATPWPFADGIELAPLGGELFAVVRSFEPDPDGFPTQVAELWSSSDVQSWEPLELPDTFGSRIDNVDIASDGSLALLTIMSSEGNSSQRSETWSTVDGRTWDPVEAGGGFDGPRSTELGWFRGDIYSQGGIEVSADGLVWQAIPFDIRPPFGAGGGGANVWGDTIVVSSWEDGGPRRMWVGKPVDG